jgi:hypothetical protein
MIVGHGAGRRWAYPSVTTTVTVKASVSGGRAPGASASPGAPPVGQSTGGTSPAFSPGSGGGQSRATSTTRPCPSAVARKWNVPSAGSCFSSWRTWSGGDQDPRVSSLGLPESHEQPAARLDLHAPSVVGRRNRGPLVARPIHGSIAARGQSEQPQGDHHSVESAAKPCVVHRPPLRRAGAGPAFPCSPADQPPPNGPPSQRARERQP